MVIILDVSGSMNKFEPPRIDIAKEAAISVLKTLGNIYVVNLNFLFFENFF